MSTPVVIKALVASNTDIAEAILDAILSRPDEGFRLFCLCHNASPLHHVAGSLVELQLHLPKKRLTSQSRCGLVLTLRLPAEEAFPFLRGLTPLTADRLSTYLDRAGALRSLTPLVELLTLSAKKQPQGDARGRVAWLRPKIVGCLRRIYRVNISARWFISTFGSHEAQFVLVTAAYYFWGIPCTIETLAHLTELFTSESGQSLAAVTSLAELGEVFGSSAWAEQTEAFAHFAHEKLRRDSREIRTVARTIDAYRGRLPLASADLVRYVYLAHAQCFNEGTFKRYSQLTSVGEIGCLPSGGVVLPSLLDRGFAEHMRTYFTRETYLAEHVRVQQLKIRMEPPAPYTWDPDPDDGLMRAWAGLSVDVARELVELARWHADEGPTYPPTLQGFLCLAGQATCRGQWNPKEQFLPPTVLRRVQRLPVFLCHFADRHYFVMTAADPFSSHLAEVVSTPTNCRLPDTCLTRALSYTPVYYSQNSLSEQLFVSRHEYFNPRLPVCNLVLDLDLKIKGPPWSLEEIYDLCRTVRREVLRLMRRLGPVSRAHPVYFFKSACPPADPDNMEDVLPFCICTGKLGFRVITPLPRGHAIVGTSAVQGFVSVLQKLMGLTACLRRMRHKIKEIGAPLFDSGVYHAGRCIRLPHTYKVDRGGGLGRQLRLFVCHPEEEDKHSYVKNALNIQNLLHHSLHVGWPAPKTFCYHIADDGRDYLIQRTRETLPPTVENVCAMIEGHLGLDLVAWVSSCIWPSLMSTLATAVPEDKFPQFLHVTFEQTGPNLVQVCHARGRNFACLRHTHRASSKNVRVFLVLYYTSQAITVTFMSQCFAGRCGANQPTAHFSISVPASRIINRAEASQDSTTSQLARRRDRQDGSFSETLPN